MSASIVKLYDEPISGPEFIARLTRMAHAYELFDMGSEPEFPPDVLEGLAKWVEYVIGKRDEP